MRRKGKMMRERLGRMALAVMPVFALAVIFSPLARLLQKGEKISLGDEYISLMAASENVELVNREKTESTQAFNSVHANGAVLIDGNSGEILYEENAHARLPMASTTKVMTALTVLDLVSPSKIVKVPSEAAGVEGSSIYLTAGENISIETLLYGLLLESGNDAATALAVVCSGSTEKFAEEMNKKAESMGLVATHFTNPHGLPDDNHYTTAYELAVIAKVALENPLIAQIVSTASVAVGGGTEESVKHFRNHNRLLEMYDGACGVKTGFTKAAGRCLVGAAKRDGRLLIAVTLGCPDDWNSHMAMFNYGFESFEGYCLAEKGDFDLSPFGVSTAAQENIYRTYKVGEGDRLTLTYRVKWDGENYSITVD